MPIQLLPAEQAWLVTLPASPAAGGSMDDERVYIPIAGRPPAAADARAGVAQLIALDRATGERRWARDIETTWPPVAEGGVVFVAASSEIHALDAATGSHLWRTAVAGPPIAPPARAGSLLIVALAPGSLLALRADDGMRAWERSLGGSAGPIAMVVEGEALYLALPGGRFVRAGLHDGHSVWEQMLPGALGQPAVAGDRVLVGSSDNHLYALDPEDGDIEWRYPAGADVVGAAATGDSVFFVALDNVLRALNRGSGNQRWKALLATRPSALPHAAGDIVLVAGLSPALAAFAATTGAPLGEYIAPSAPASPPLVDLDLKPFRVAIVTITADGRVVGLRPTQMMFREPAPVPLPGLPGTRLEREPNR